MNHDLKCWPRFFQPLQRGLKKFELRPNDRNFALGDTITEREYLPERNEFTGQTFTARVTYLMQHEDMPEGIPAGWCILSLQAVLGETRPAPIGASRMNPGESLQPATARILEITPVGLLIETNTGERLKARTPDFPVKEGDVHGYFRSLEKMTIELQPHTR